MPNRRPARSDRFHARIALERTVLDVLNRSALGATAKLSGLTSVALEDWARRAGGQRSGDSIVKVARLLNEIACESGLIVEQSRAIADLDSGQTRLKIERLTQRLETTLEMIG